MYSDVYRRWVLNEDGFFTGQPYLSGNAFSLADLFDDEDVQPQPLIFGANLALQDDGTAIRPIVEMSTNAGADWSIFPNLPKLLTNRAGVYLDIDTLPLSFLTAAKNGQARIRITATLQNPTPVQASRWRGNAFTGQLPPRYFDVKNLFRFQRISSQSIHYNAVQSGDLTADTVDSTQALEDWLTEQLTLHSQSGASRGGKGVLELAGTWPMLRIGDRLLNAGGPGRSINGEAQAITRNHAHINSIHADNGTSTKPGSSTRINLTF